MTRQEYNTAADRWNAGESLAEIAAFLSLGIYDLQPIIRAATREAIRMHRDGVPTGPVFLSHLPEDQAYA